MSIAEIRMAVGGAFLGIAMWGFQAFCLYMDGDFDAEKQRFLLGMFVTISPLITLYVVARDKLAKLESERREE